LSYGAPHVATLVFPLFYISFLFDVDASCHHGYGELKLFS
jgi:hypothetical protein